MLFGLDGQGRPLAATFAADQAALALKAATSLKLQTLKIETAEQTDLAKQLPVGSILAAGRATVPLVSKALFDKLLALRPTSANPPKGDAPAAAGLRACEIAGLQWSMVMTDNGKIGDVIDIRDTIAKRGAGRRIPTHPDLQRALAALWRVQTSNRYIVASNRGGPMRANSIVNWFVVLFAELGIDGCSSHSGRRTFITIAAKNVHRAGGSLRDVQLLAGHQSIDTTQRYIDGDTPSQRRLVSLL